MRDYNEITRDIRHIQAAIRAVRLCAMSDYALISLKALYEQQTALETEQRVFWAKHFST